MNANLLYYPTDFSTASNSDSENSGATGLELAVRDLQNSARETALRQTHTRRIGGQTGVRNQNAYISAKPFRVPLNKVGVAPTVYSALGTVGYWICGQDGVRTEPASIRNTAIERFSLISESALMLGTRATEERQWPSTVGTDQAWWTAGGWGDTPTALSRTIDRFTYLKETIFRIGKTLRTGKYMQTGMGSKFSGYWCGGSDAGWGGFFDTSGRQHTSEVEKITYSSELVMSMGNTLLGPRNGCLTTAGSRFAGYLFGGATNHPTVPYGWQPILTIDKLTYSGETWSQLGSALSHSHIGSGKAGNQTKVWIVGGWTAGDQNAWFTNAFKISSFTLSNETVLMSALVLSAPKTSLAGMGSSVAGYFSSGWYPTGSEISFKVVDKINYSSETLFRLGSQMKRGRSESGAFSNYAEGFSR